MAGRYDHDAVNAQLRQKYGDTVTFQQLVEFREQTGIDAQWIRVRADLRTARGVYRIPKPGEVEPDVTPAPAPARPSTVTAFAAPAAAPAPAPVKTLFSTDPVVQHKFESLQREASLLATVPERLPEFVPFGDYEMIRAAVKARRFRTIFISGLSGNGKTFFVEQACAAEGREYVFCPITEETEEDDLIGGFRLKDGETVFEPGPVVVAMLRGCPLLLDELDKAGKRIMILQSVLDGKPLTIKKLGITIRPTQGFCIFATANTKGRGDDTGRFSTSNILDEALLERFAITVEQEYPTANVERRILRKTYEADGYTAAPHALTFFDTLAKWAEAIRKTFEEGGVEDVISTRRLVHIVRNYELFEGDDQKAIAYGCNRFDSQVKESFAQLYNKLAPNEAPSNVGRWDE